MNTLADVVKKVVGSEKSGGFGYALPPNRNPVTVGEKYLSRMYGPCRCVKLTNGGRVAVMENASGVQWEESLYSLSLWEWGWYERATLNALKWLTYTYFYFVNEPGDGENGTNIAVGSIVRLLLVGRTAIKFRYFPID